MAKSNLRSKASPKSAKARLKKIKSGPKASEEFGGEIYASDDWKRLKKKHPGGFQATLLDLEKKDWDDGTAWYATLEGHDKLAKISTPSGRALGEAFGDSLDDWKGRTIHVTPMQYSVGWGPVIDPIIEDDTDEESPDDYVPDLDDDEDSLD
jgi:hypothetical protein